MKFDPPLFSLTERPISSKATAQRSILPIFLMKAFQHLSLSLLALVAVGLFLHLPDASAQEAQEDQSLTFTAYLWSEPEGRVLTSAPTGGPSPDGGPQMGDYIPLTLGWLDKDGTLRDFEATARSFSLPQEYRGPNPIVFAVHRPGGTPEVPSYQEVGRVTIPPNVEEAILFFFPRANRVGTYYDISLLPSSPRDIPSGQAQVVNLSGAPIAARLGDQNVALQPHGAKKINLSGLVNNRLPVALGAQGSDGQWQIKLQRNISMVANTGLLILFHQDNGNYRMESIRLRR